MELLARFGLADEDAAAWRQAGGADFEDWLVDRVARRPSGRRAREVYGADDVHDFARAPVLQALDLGSDDRLLDLGCGGGLLLRDAAATGASVAGIDHSEEMVELARERVPGAQIVLGEVEQLPFPDGSFTAVSMVIVMLFLAEPARALAEGRRVLRADGRLAAYTPGPGLRGTPAAPEPLASRCFFHTDEELLALAREAGFGSARVGDHGGAQLLLARA